jgi:uncharacterized protein
MFSCRSSLPTNALIDQKSLYLRQHAYNPVNWKPWTDHTLAQAKAADKLMVISIGYAACHWCHVMEKESFADPAVALFMNTHFTSIKVDREERPDIDNIYMAACQLTNASGCGWPLNVIALPDGRPVWVGSYLPKDQWMAKLAYFEEVSKNNAAKLNAYAAHLKGSIQENRLSMENKTDQRFSVKSMVDNIITNLDFDHGGINQTPKFPTPGLFQFLLKYNRFLPNDSLQKALHQTLQGMAKSGLYDQLGGGFGRYSTDAEWQVPHFEKMLYDNAQLVSLYAGASIQNADYKQIVEQTLAFLEQSLKAEKGGFYASLNADIENTEGAYYTWTKREIYDILGDDAATFCTYYSISDKGNFENNKNILRVKSQLNKKPKALNAKVLAVRNTRPAPTVDHKIVTSHGTPSW